MFLLGPRGFWSLCVAYALRYGIAFALAGEAFFIFGITVSNPAEPLGYYIFYSVVALPVWGAFGVCAGLLGGLVAAFLHRPIASSVPFQGKVGKVGKVGDRLRLFAKARLRRPSWDAPFVSNSACARTLSPIARQSPRHPADDRLPSPAAARPSPPPLRLRSFPAPPSSRCADTLAATTPYPSNPVDPAPRRELACSTTRTRRVRVVIEMR